MAKKKADVKKSVDAFIEFLRKEIPVEQVILFGSCAKGTATSESDIDLIVVSPSFSRRKHIENMQYLFRRAAKVDSRIEPVPASPKEIINLDERTFLGQAVASGRIYYSAVRV